jgi:YaiO family outer membrane protein
VKRPAALLAFLVWSLAAPAAPAAAQAGDNTPLARAQRAMGIKDYRAAVEVCLFHLAVTPDDYDLNFVLAQAYAFSNRWDNALEVLVRMRAAEPRNTDVLLLESRVLSWKKRYREALAGYGEVLRIDPGNGEALRGIADVDAWTRPKAAPRSRQKREVRYGHAVESFSDDRASFQSDRLSVHLGLPGGTGPLIVKAGQTVRFGERDFQFGLEAYPRLWPRAYGRLELDVSPKAAHYPGSSYLAEIYQGLPSSAEASVGVWHMRFPSRPVTVFLGSLAWSLGRYYPCARFNYGSEDGLGLFSWTLQLRRYFSDESFVYAGWGRGARPFENATLQDLLEVRAGVLTAGAVWHAFGKVRVELHYARTSEPELVRNMFQVSAGWRWR